MALAPLEVDLAARIVAWLEADGWTVYQEVEHFDSPRIADLVAWKKGIVWVVEVKASAGLEVLEQATHYRGSAHRISVAAPLPASPRLSAYLPKLCVELGLGLFNLASPDKVEVLEWPKWDGAVQSIGFALREEHRRCAPAGSQSGGRAGGTAVVGELIRDFVQANHGSSLEEIAKGLQLPWGGGPRSVLRLREMVKKNQIPGVRPRKFGGQVCLYPDDSPLVSGAR